MMSLLIFDVDGVMFDDKRLAEVRHTKLISEIAKRFSISIAEAETRYRKRRESLPLEKRHTSSYLFTSFGFSRQEFFDAVDSVDPRGLIEPGEGCVKSLAALSKEHVVVTYSNTPRKASERTLDALGVRQYVKRMFCADDFAESKPSTANLKRIIEEIGFGPEETFAIGNSLKKDIMPAKELGIRTVLFDPEGTRGEPTEADVVIRYLAELRYDI